MQAFRNHVARISKLTRANRSSYVLVLLTSRRHMTGAIMLLLLFVLVGSAFRNTTLYTDEVIDGPVLAVPGPASLCMHTGSPGTKPRITFIDTTGSTCLTARQSCAVESAARANPDMDVYVYFNIRKSDDFQVVNSDKPGKVPSCDITDNLKQYRNIKFIFDDVVDYLSETRLAQFYADGKMKQRSWAFSLLSQLLGLLELHETGGVYLDLDVMVLRPLHCLRNTLSVVGSSLGLESKAMIFDRKHPFPSFALNHIASKLETGKPTTSLSAMLADAFREFCSAQSLSPGEFSCQSDTKLTLLEEQSFVPVRNELFEQFVSAGGKEAFDLNHLSRAYLILTDASQWTSKLPTTSMYSSFARNYCPSTMLDVGRLKIKYGL